MAYILFAIVVLLLLWEFLGKNYYRIGLLMSFPSRLAEYGLTNHLRLFKDAMYTTIVSAVGFTFAGIVGAATGIAAFRYPAIRKWALNGFQFFQVVPTLAFAPFVTMLFGVGFFSHSFIAFIVGVFPFTSLLVDALWRLPEAYFELAKLYCLPFRMALRHIYMPLAVPAAFAAGRVVFSVCVVGATVAEFMGARYGLGRNVFEGALRLEPELLVLSTSGIVLIGLCGVAGLRRIEASLVKWRL